MEKRGDASQSEMLLDLSEINFGNVGGRGNKRLWGCPRFKIQHFMDFFPKPNSRQKGDKMFNFVMEKSLEEHGLS